MSAPLYAAHREKPFRFCPSYPDRCGGCEDFECEGEGCTAPSTYRVTYPGHYEHHYCEAHVPADARAIAEEED